MGGGGEGEGRQVPDADAGHQLDDLRAKPGHWPRLGSPELEGQACTVPALAIFNMYWHDSIQGCEDGGFEGEAGSSPEALGRGGAAGVCI